jgi:hypothetical protein
MPDEQRGEAETPETTPQDDAGKAGEAAAEATAQGEAGKAKAKRAGEKPRRTHGERAMANLRAAKRGQREVSEPADRARFLLAEANVLALLDVAAALGGSASDEEEKAGTASD